MSTGEIVAVVALCVVVVGAGVWVAILYHSLSVSRGETLKARSAEMRANDWIDMLTDQIAMLNHKLRLLGGTDQDIADAGKAALKKLNERKNKEQDAILGK